MSVPHSLWKLSPEHWKFRWKDSITLINSFFEIPFISLLRLDYLKLPIFLSPWKLSCVNSLILEIYFTSFPVFLFLQKFSIVQFIFFDEDEKPLVSDDLFVVVLAEIKTVFVLFDERDGNLDSTKFVKRSHYFVDRLSWGLRFEKRHFLLKVRLYDCWIYSSERSIEPTAASDAWLRLTHFLFFESIFLRRVPKLPFFFYLMLLLFSCRFLIFFSIENYW